MPSYTDLDRLSARFGVDMLVRLTDRADVATGMIDAEVVQKACDDTQSLIDGYLASRYALPLTDLPPLVSALAEDIAIWRLSVFETDPKLKSDYEGAMRTLRDIATGTIRLPGAAGVETPGIGGTGALFTDRERPLTEASMKGYI